MKHLLAPTFAVIMSTAGTAYGCHAFGMPARDVAIATLMAGSASSIAAFGAVLLARPKSPTRVRAHAPGVR